MSTTELLVSGASSWVISSPLGYNPGGATAVNFNNSILLIGWLIEHIFLIFNQYCLGGAILFTTDKISVFDSSSESWADFGQINEAGSYRAVNVVNYDTYSKYCISNTASTTTEPSRSGEMQ